MPKHVVRGLRAVSVLATMAAFSLTGQTAVFLATGLVNVSPDCVHGYLARWNLISGHTCVAPPGYGPWMAVLGVVGAVVGGLFALGLMHAWGRSRSRRRGHTLAP